MMRDHQGGPSQPRQIRNLGGHPKSEIDDQPVGDDRRLAIEWTTGL